MARVVGAPVARCRLWSRGFRPGDHAVYSTGSQLREVRACGPPPGHRPSHRKRLRVLCTRSIEGRRYLRADVGFPASARCA